MRKRQRATIDKNNQTIPTEEIFSHLSIKDRSSQEKSKSVTMATAPANTDQLDNMLNLNVQSSSKVNIKLPQDKEIPRISSCTFLPSGELLLVDRRNCSLTVKFKKVLSPDRPWDV